ncbi:aromatic peroxygenase precursor [Coprinopsis marcescibilis]|uniref:Aromatic peroxygenase n=1 Tax=Coprinopsis marcescibilis TaxID=230819 RepID=A0A5C3KNQ6_COPMA|nr:aromatic peroxygenase precursor [Coprinopsis marcescibilis]
MALKSLSILLFALATASQINAFPQYGSLGGLEARQEEDIARGSSGSNSRVPPPPPAPPSFTGAKLVDDRDHPWRPLRRGDIRGPCPGLNTLASHGYLPRDGVASPSDIIKAVQEGFNMETQGARIATYSAHILEGNLVTDLLSIGGKTSRTGPDPPAPATVAGISNHGSFEGDASMTRVDAFFGDHTVFNQPLFDQFVDFSNRFGNGFYNYTVGGELRFHRIQQSIATNPQFSIRGFRHITAYGEAAFVANLFVDGRKTGANAHHLDMDSALNFFRDMRFPRGFFRPSSPTAAEGADIIFAAHPTQPGRNNGAVNSFVVDTSMGGLTDPCTFYVQFVNTTVRALYPNPTGVLRRNLIINLGFFYDALAPPNCPQVFPYGQN